MRSFTIPSVYTVIDKFTAPIRRMASSHAQFAGSLQTGVARGERLFRKLTPAIGETTRQMFAFAKSAAIAGAVLGAASFTTKSLVDYEDALASTQAVTGTTNEQFVAFRSQINTVARDTKKSAVDVAKSFELIGSAKPELLASADALGAVTKASIVLSKASRDDLATSAMNLTGVMNQFNLAADKSDMVINVLSAGAKVGSASISNVGESMKNFGSVASGANLSLEQSVALVEVLGKFSVFGAEAGTKLRGSILKLQQAGVGYKSGQFAINDALAEAKARIDKLKTAKQQDAAVLKLFGAENIATGKILLNNIALFDEYTKGVTGTQVAQEMAAVNTNTFKNVLSEASAAWVNMITGAEGSGKALTMATNVIRFLTNNMEKIVNIGVKVLLFFAAWKTLLLVTRAALFGYNVVLGITGALSGVASVAIGKSSVALAAYNIATKAATAAQWLWNAAMSANPIGLIIIGVAALIGLIVLIVRKWDEWGAALSIFLGPLGLVLSVFMAIRRNWDMLVQAFTQGGLLAGIKALGRVLFDAILMPVQQIMSLIGKFTGADWAATAAKGIELMRKNLDVNVEPTLNPKAAEQEGMANRMETVEKQKVGITIEDKTGRAKVESDNDLVPIRLSSTWSGG